MEKDKEQTPLKRRPDGSVAGILSMGDMLDDEDRAEEEDDTEEDDE